MFLKAALNGDWGAGQRPGLPVGVDALAADAIDCVRLGVHAVHLHPRDGEGRESLHAHVVDDVVERVRVACGVPVGVSTGAWIEPDPAHRAALVAAWRAPDFASVNLSEPGAVSVMAACTQAGIGIEAGLWSAEDVAVLAESGLADGLVRVLVELIDLTPEQARRRALTIHAALDHHGVDAPRLQHGEGPATWPMLTDAARRGLQMRIGLEDTDRMPDGRLATGNAELVSGAIEIIRAPGPSASVRSAPRPA